MKKISGQLFSLVLLLALLGPVPVRANQDMLETAVNGKVHIYYFSELHRENARWVKQAVEKVWPLYQRYFGIEPPSAAVYIGNVFYQSGGSTEDVYGLTRYIGGQCYIDISDYEKKVTQSTVAHEFFHCWQYAMNFKPYVQNSWFWEATAVWAESWVYPNNNTEHEYLDEFFRSLDSYFFDDWGTREYGSYLYFYYLWQKNNWQVEPVISLIKELQNKSQQQVIEQNNFSDNLREFALWNWNKEPARYYQDSPQFPEVRPRGGAIVLMSIKKSDDKNSISYLLGGGIVYYVIKVDNEIDKLKFDLRQANSLADSNLGLQALWQAGGSWHQEDWSNLAEKVFCRHRPEEKVDKIVLILTNADLNDDSGDQMARAGLQIAAKGECPRRWHGTTSFKTKYKQPFGSGQSQLTLSEELEMKKLPDGSRCLAVKKQQVVFQSKTKVDMPCPFIGAGGSITKIVTESGQTSRSAPADTPADQLICRFYQPQGGSWQFDPTVEIYGKCDYVSSTEDFQGSCSWADLGSTSESESKSTGGLCHSISGLDFIGLLPVDFKEGDEQIRGQEVRQVPAISGLTDLDISWNYSYD